MIPHRAIFSKSPGLRVSESPPPPEESEVGPAGSEVDPGGSKVGPGGSKVGPGGSEVGPKGGKGTDRRMYIWKLSVLQDIVPFWSTAQKLFSRGRSTQVRSWPSSQVMEKNGVWPMPMEIASLCGYWLITRRRNGSQMHWKL